MRALAVCAVPFLQRAGALVLGGRPRVAAGGFEHERAVNRGGLLGQVDSVEERSGFHGLDCDLKVFGSSLVIDFIIRMR